jgi:transposase InsO family protein
MDDGKRSIRERWAVLRFAVVARLLAEPPPKGALQEELRRLSVEEWRHPESGEVVRFGTSTIERWYYLARWESDPVAVLRRKVRCDKGTLHVPAAIQVAVKKQHGAHPTWTYRLHHDNLVALAEQEELGEVPSYTTVLRFMKRSGLVKQRRRGAEGSRAERRSVGHERRSFEVAHVNGLWHLDFHECSRAVVTPWGTLERLWCLGILDDHSRLCCHIQWYWHEDAESLCHGLMQAIMKRGLPRRLMTDNGAAMKAEETREGLVRLGILHELTLEYSPEENGKQEHFWTAVEGRLVAMLEGVPDLTPELLNDATQAWVECEYNRQVHGETGEAPLQRFLHGSQAGRRSPECEALRRAFRVQRTRTQRRSDGTISLDGVRLEVPSRYRTLPQVHVRYARWDLRSVALVDPDAGVDLCPLYPLDRQRNADGRRAALQPVEQTEPPPPSGVAPLLKKLMADYAATGLLPAYTPMVPREDLTRETDDSSTPEGNDDKDDER